MKIAILGTWHVHAPEYTGFAKKLGEVVGVYEENEKWRADFAAAQGIPAFSSLDEALASDAEGVIVCSSTDMHPEYIIKAAEAGKHIFTEKVLALTEAECAEIKEAVEKNGVRFVISYPWKSNGGVIAVKELVDSGAVGHVNYLRFRNCHNGSTAHWLPAHFYSRSECGGGAMIDLGAHGMYLAHMFLGEPSAYSSTFTHFCRDEADARLNPDGIEDNAVTSMGFESGAIAVNETGFVSGASPVVLEVSGESGQIVYNTWDGEIVLRNGEGKRILSPAAGKKLPIEAFLLGEDVDGCGIGEAVVLTRMMEGAYSQTE